MSLQIYNSLSRQKESFEPLASPKVKMYVCGPTVYGLAHVGNFRNVVFNNLLCRWLEHLGYQVEFALNLTDVDDRIIQRAKTENTTSEKIASVYTEEYFKDLNSLQLRRHDHNPKVTEHIPQIMALISKLVEAKKAYVAGTGEVFYSVEAFADYGKLSRRKTDELEEGSRIEVDPYKKSPMDFSLWKPQKPGEPSWKSPWGEGRPGWHIECSAMCRSLFGDQVDIHGGGLDLLFPHHENEIAQSEGATGKTFAKYWVHCNMLNFGGAKMSKSVGNLITLREFLTKHPAEIYKYMILSVSYRSICDFGDEAIRSAYVGLGRIYSALRRAETLVYGNAGHEVPVARQNIPNSNPTLRIDTFREAWSQIGAAMNDDINTPQVLAVIFNLVRELNAKVPAKDWALEFLTVVRSWGFFAALFQEVPSGFLREIDDRMLREKSLERTEIDRLVEERFQARFAKNFSLADEIRLKLTELGIEVRDSASGPEWEVKK